MAVHCNLGRFPKHLEPAMSFHHPAQAFHTELRRVLIQQYHHYFNYFPNSNLIIIITTIRCMSQKVWGFMHQTAPPTCIKARQSLSKWDESLLRRSFARFRLKVNSSTFQVIFSSSMSTCGCICMFSLSCSSGYMSDLLVPFIKTKK